MKNDIYGEPTVIKHKNITATIYSPILTEEEKNRRYDAIKKATVKLMMNKERNNKCLVESTHSIGTDEQNVKSHSQFSPQLQ